MSKSSSPELRDRKVSSSSQKTRSVPPVHVHARYVHVLLVGWFKFVPHDSLSFLLEVK